MAKYDKRKYQVGEWWVGQRSNSPAYYRCRFNKDTGQVERVTLGTTDWVEACKRLDAWFVVYGAMNRENPTGVKLDGVLTRYWERHGQYQKSAQSLKECIDRWRKFYGDALVGDLTVERQEAFIEELRLTLKPSSIMRVLNVGKAAINRAVKRGELERAPTILTVPLGRMAPKGRPLTVDEMRAIYKHASPHVQQFIVWALGTAARPEAVLELQSNQIDWELGLVDLLPIGKEQVPRKYRPTVRLPDSLWNVFEGRAVSFHGRRLHSIKKGLWQACDRAKVARCSSYSFRHTAARWMRAKGVPPWDVACQLGHSVGGYSVTERYASHSPDYLAAPVKALDELIKTVTVGGAACVTRTRDPVITKDV